MHRRHRSWSRLPGWGAVLLLPLLTATPAAAAPGGGTIVAGDTAWMLGATALVLSMTIPGLSLLYAGLVRAKNALSIVMQCFAITAWVSVLWLLYGYSLAFSTVGMHAGTFTWHSLLGGLDRVGLAHLAPQSIAAVAPTVPESVFLAFQLTFAVITPALIISSFAERVRFSAVMCFTTLWLTVVYLPLCHMDWSGPGSLFGDLFGTQDLAGGCVVEIASGISGLVAALMVGRRIGYPRLPPQPHAVALAVVGGGMLWVGWFGFNAGSTLRAGGAAGMAVLSTHAAAAAATCTWILIEWWRFGKPSALGAVTGSLAGLVAITPGCGVVGPMGAMALGALAAIACYLMVAVVKPRLGYDDTLDVFGVHGIAGVLGTLLLAVVGLPAWGGSLQGVTLGGQLWSQCEAVGVTIAWSAIGTFLVMLVVSRTLTVRVAPLVEAAGLDGDQHGEAAYQLEERA